jgi:iron(III) transport system substrate-binding protein
VNSTWTAAGALLACMAMGLTLWPGCERSTREVVAYTSVDQVFSEPLFREFERRTGIRVRAVFDTEEAKSTGVLYRLIAEAGHPQADVFFSGDPARPFLLIKRGLVEPYVSPQASAIPGEFRASDGMWTGSSARARVLLVNRDRLAGREEPRSIRDLADPKWKGEATLANPLYGTTTMHAAALFAAWGDGEAKRFFESLRTNDVRVAGSNGEVKRLVVSGEATFGLTDTDDANEASRAGADVAVVYPDQDGIGTLVIPTAVVLLKGGPNGAAGQALIDFLLSDDAEREMAERAAQMPLRSGVTPPAGVRSERDIRAMAVDYAALGETMERVQPWLRSWAGF